MRISDRRVTVICGFLLCLGLINTCLSLFFPAHFRMFSVGSDFYAYHVATKQWLKGASIYLFDPTATLTPANQFGVITRFLYPPIALVPVFPFGMLPFKVGFILWSAVGLTLWIWLLRYWSNILGLHTTPAARRLLLLTGLLFYPLVHHLGVGQFEILVLSLMTLGLRAFDQAPWKAGVWFGIAAVLKVYPVLLPMYLLFHSPRRALPVCVAALAVIASLTLIMLIGCTDSTLADFVNVLRFKERYGSTNIINQSLVAFVQRLGVFAGWPDHFQVFKLILTCFVLMASVGVLKLGSLMPANDVLIKPYAVFALSYPLYASYFWIQQFVLLLPVLLFVTVKAVGRPSLLLRCGVLCVWLVSYSGMFKAPGWSSPYSLTLPALLFFNRYLWAHILLGLMFMMVLRSEKNALRYLGAGGTSPPLRQSRTYSPYRPTS